MAQRALRVEPNRDNGSWLAEEFSGRVLYDSPDGTTYTAPYIDPGTEQASLSNWYENCFRQLYCADLSFPNSGTNRRGYIACSLHPLSDNASSLNGQFYYVHQSSRFQYPIQTAREYQDFNVDKHRRSYAPFERMQDYFVLLRNEDGVWRSFVNNSAGMPHLLRRAVKGAILFHKREWPL